MENEKFTPEQVLNEAKKIVKEKELIHQEEMDKVDEKMPDDAYDAAYNARDEYEKKKDLGEQRYKGDGIFEISSDDAKNIIKTN